jgi:CelD/BcsL family acetyltransferase involved in cellulose biosynthesis
VTARGLGEVLEWTREGRVEVSALLLRGPRSLYVHHVGASRHAVERLQWSSLLVWEGLARARALGRAELGLGYGNEGYKARWASHEVPYERIRLGRGLLGHAFFGARRARHAVRRLRRRSGSGAQ